MTKKSGPLAFLNKKGWHPGNQRNQEKVWKKEQEALAEKKQVEELRKQYEEARQKEEVEAMAVAAGVKKKQERLDWMYQGGMVAKQEAEKRADAQLLGEKDVDLPTVTETSKGEQVAQLPAFYTQDTPASANEMWQKLHGDPMFAIKQQELIARKKIVSNPVQMDMIRKRLKEKAEAKAARKAAKATAKAARKAAKKAKKHEKARKDSSSDSESDKSQEDRSAKRARIASRSDSLAGTASESKLRQPAKDRETDYHRRGAGDLHHGVHGKRNNSRKGYHEERPQNGHPDHRDRRGLSERDRSGGERWNDESRQQSDSRHRERHRHEPYRREDAYRDSSPRAERPANGESKLQKIKVHHDAASAQDRNLSYGLNKAINGVEEDRDAKRRETEKRLEEARLRHAAEEKEKASQRYQRKEHRTGQLSEEEKARRLAEMSGNADAHEDARWARLHAARKRDDSQAEQEAIDLQKKVAANAAPGSRHQETADFLREATKQSFGGENASLADRIGRRKYYNDRSKDETQGAFQR